MINKGAYSWRHHIALGISVTRHDTLGTTRLYNWWTLMVYHFLQVLEAVVYIGSVGYLTADWSAYWLFSRE